MVKCSVMYPSGDGKTFDFDYYLQKHIPMVAELAGNALKRVDVDSGLSGGAPGSVPPYLAVAHLVFDSVDDYQAAMGPHSEKFSADVPNYTNTTPSVQLSTIVK